MATEIQTDGCNGWAIIPKTMLQDDDGRNFHIVEVQIETDKDGKEYISRYALKACCGLHMKRHANFSDCRFFRKERQNSLRLNLAEWQNTNEEHCGKCVGHFYKDPPQA